MNVQFSLRCGENKKLKESLKSLNLNYIGESPDGKITHVDTFVEDLDSFTKLLRRIKMELSVFILIEQFDYMSDGYCGVSLTLIKPEKINWNPD